MRSGVAEVRARTSDRARRGPRADPSHPERPSEQGSPLPKDENEAALTPSPMPGPPATAEPIPADVAPIAENRAPDGFFEKPLDLTWLASTAVAAFASESRSDEVEDVTRPTTEAPAKIEEEAPSIAPADVVASVPSDDAWPDDDEESEREEETPSRRVLGSARRVAQGHRVEPQAATIVEPAPSLDDATWSTPEEPVKRRVSSSRRAAGRLREEARGGAPGESPRAGDGSIRLRS